MIRFDLCGMGVDLLRSCYRTTMRLRSDSAEETDIQWFFCHPKAKVYPGYTRFASGNWAHAKFPWTGAGEVEGAERPWVNGRPPKTCMRGQGFCGPWQAIADGASVGHPALPKRLNGAAKCCPGCPAAVGLTSRLGRTDCGNCDGGLPKNLKVVASGGIYPSLPITWKTKVLTSCRWESDQFSAFGTDYKYQLRVSDLGVWQLGLLFVVGGAFVPFPVLTAADCDQYGRWRTLEADFEIEDAT